MWSRARSRRSCSSRTPSRWRRRSATFHRGHVARARRFEDRKAWRSERPRAARRHRRPPTRAASTGASRAALGRMHCRRARARAARVGVSAGFPVAPRGERAPHGPSRAVYTHDIFCDHGSRERARARRGPGRDDAAAHPAGDARLRVRGLRRGRFVLAAPGAPPPRGVAHTARRTPASPKKIPKSVMRRFSARAPNTPRPAAGRGGTLPLTLSPPNPPFALLPSSPSRGGARARAWRARSGGTMRGHRQDRRLATRAARGSSASSTSRRARALTASRTASSAWTAWRAPAFCSATSPGARAARRRS